MKRVRTSRWNIVINLKHVTSMDVAGIATFIEFTKILNELKGIIKLAELPEKAKTLFEMTKSLKLFSVYDSEDEALAAFSE